jgi:hypothetical protein
LRAEFPQRMSRERTEAKEEAWLLTWQSSAYVSPCRRSVIGS